MKLSADLSLEQTPPLAVPLRFFLLAPWFAVAAGLVLTLRGATAMSSRWTQEALAAIHLVALGWLGMVMLGALLQVLPVVVGARVPASAWLSRTIAPLIAVGVAALASAFLGGPAFLFHLALTLLGVGLCVLILLTLAATWRARPTRETPRGIVSALVALAVTLSLGLTLLAGWAFPTRIPLERLRLTNVHALWATSGWVVLLVVAMSYQVVPMFQMTPEYPRWLQRGLARVVLGTLTPWTVARLTLERPTLLRLIDQAAIAVLTLAVGTYAVRTLIQQHQRRRRIYDTTVRFWQLGMLMLLAACASLLAGALTSLGEHPRFGWWLGITFLIGFGGSVTAGMLYKIVPFLAWLHLQNRLLAATDRPTYKLPTMKAFLPERWSRVHVILHTSSLVLLLAAVLAPALTRAAGVTFVVAAATQGANLVHMALRARHEQRLLMQAIAEPGFASPTAP